MISSDQYKPNKESLRPKPMLQQGDKCLCWNVGSGLGHPLFDQFKPPCYCETVVLNNMTRTCNHGQTVISNVSLYHLFLKYNTSYSPQDQINIIVLNLWRAHIWKRQTLEIFAMSRNMTHYCDKSSSSHTFTHFSVIEKKKICIYMPDIMGCF